MSDQPRGGIQRLNRALLRTLMSQNTAAIVADRLEELERENAELQNVIGETRAASIYAMDEIRAALGVPLGCDDKTSNRVVDYVRELVDRSATLNHQLAEAGATQSHADAFRENDELRRDKERLEQAARDMLSTFREDGLTTLVSAERQEAWQAAIDSKKKAP